MPFAMPRGGVVTGSRQGQSQGGVGMARWQQQSSRNECLGVAGEFGAESVDGSVGESMARG